MIQIDLKKPYNYATNSIFPHKAVELMPINTGIDYNLSNLGITISDVESIKKYFESVKDRLVSLLATYGFSEEYAAPFFLMELVHNSKEHPPKPEDAVPGGDVKSLEDYDNIAYAHCGNKSNAMGALCKAFGLEYDTISYRDIQSWAHSFIEVLVEGKKEIFCPAFNMWINFSHADVIENPFRDRRYLYFYSPAHFSMSKNGDSFDKTIGKYITEKGHTTKKYNLTWFSLMGISTLVPPIHTLHKNGELVYDITKDPRFNLIQ